MNRYVIALLIFMFSCFGHQVRAKVWNADNIPMVHLRDVRRYVCDPENMMSVALRDSTDLYLNKLEKESGIQTVFVIVPNVESGDAFRVAQDLGNKQGVGDKKTNKGLIVVVAVNDRRYFIAPGDGLEGDLTDVECDDIARACIVKNMRLGNIDMAMLSTAKAVYSKFKTGKTGLESTEDDLSDGFAAVIVILIVFFWIIWSIKNGGKGGRGGRNRGSVPFIWGNPGHINDNHFGGGSFGGGSFGGGSFGGGGAGGGW